MADDRIFRITKAGRGKDRITYHSRTSVSGMFSTTLYSRPGPARPDILKIEATNAGATDGWTEVTDEFRNPPRPKIQCRWHKAYTGVRRPSIWAEPRHEWSIVGWRGCKCAAIYALKHPEYPTHDVLCSITHMDPKTCSCQMLKKLTE